MSGKFKHSVMDWKGHDFCERIRMCVSMLYIHGYMTDGEKEKIQKRIEKDYLKESRK